MSLFPFRWLLSSANTHYLFLPPAPPLPPLGKKGLCKEARGNFVREREREHLRRGGAKPGKISKIRGEREGGGQRAEKMGHGWLASTTLLPY